LLPDAILLRMQPDQQVIHRWTGSAQFWEKHREIIRQMFAPVTDALVADAQIASRQSVLDIATGPGEPALTIASLVGPQGKIVGVDAIDEMVAAARREANRLELKNVQFDVAFADHLPFPNDTFDAVISRFGVMFFPSPLDSIREMLRVLKPGHKMALAVWPPAERNAFHYLLSRIVDRYVAPAPLEPDARDAFRFATPGKLLKIVTEAGVSDPTEDLFQFTMRASISVEDFFALRLEVSEKLREKFSMLSPHQQTELKREALESIRKYCAHGEIRLPAEVLIVSGTKPRVS
jgi:ubiquinone/menaquinone biosynthesis C-methylase UbiE